MLGTIISIVSALAAVAAAWVTWKVYKASKADVQFKDISDKVSQHDTDIALLKQGQIDGGTATKDRLTRIEATVDNILNILLNVMKGLPSEKS